MRPVSVVSTAMAALALGAAGLLYLKVERLEDALGKQRAAPREPVPGAETARGSESAPRAAPSASWEPDTAREDAPADGSAGASGAGSDAEPASVDERLSRLEREQKKLVAERSVPWRGFSQRFARNVDDLATQLSLTTTQRTRIEEAVERGRQRIEDVLKIPDDTGKSPFERRAEARKKLEEAMKNPQPGGVLAFAADLMTYSDKKIPGRNDTYNGEVKRIRKETREEMATALDAKQREAFDETNVDGLLGEGAGQVSFAFATAGDEAMGDVRVESVIEEEEEVPPPAPPSGGGR